MSSEPEAGTTRDSGGALSPSDAFAMPAGKPVDYTDGRKPGDWKSKYPKEARDCINFEACCLTAALVISVLASGFFLGMGDQYLPMRLNSEHGPPVLNVSFRLLMIFAVGSLGGTTFSIKWLIHSTAKCKWHLDRRYWRFFVPLIGGVYACVVLTLLDAGLLGQASGQPRSIPTAAALAFLVGYFSDGVSGLLSNVANAVFGTLEKK